MALPPIVAACVAALEAQAKPARQAAEDQIKAMLAERPDQALYDLVACTANPEAPEAVATLCALRAKNYVKYDMEASSGVDLARLKDALVAAIPAVESDRVRRQLCECARVVHQEEPWDDLLPLLLAQLSQSAAAAPRGDARDERRCLSALQLLYVVIRPFKTMGLVSVEEQTEASNALLPMLPPLAQCADPRIWHMMLKLFDAMLANTTPPALKGPTFDNWMNFLLAFAGDRRPEYRGEGYDIYLKCMKRIANVSHRLVQLAARQGKKQPKVAKHFVTHFGASFVNLWLAWLRFLASRPRDERDDHVKVSVKAINFIREATAVRELYPLLPVQELCTQLLFPCFPFNEADEELWSCDIQEYLRRLADPEGSNTNERHSATKALLALVTAKKDFHSTEHLRPVLEFVHQGLQQPPSRETDGFLFMLGMLRKSVKKVPAFSASMEGVLVSCIAPLMRSDITVLRAKAVWICGLYAGVPFQDHANFEAMLRAVLAGLDDPESPVRMQVVASLANFMALKRSHPYLREVLTPLARECVRLIDDNNSDFAVNALQALVEVFGPELAAHLRDICRSLVQRYKAAAFDIAAAADAGAANDDDAIEQAETAGERATFAAESALRAVSSCVEALGYDEEGIAALEEPLCDVVVNVLEGGDLELMELALKVYDRLVYFRKAALAPSSWRVFPLLHSAVMESGAVDLFPQLLPVFDNLCTYLPGELVQPERLRMLHEMIAKMLAPDVYAEPSAVTSAVELISVLFLQLAGIRPAFDAGAAEFLGLTLQALQTTDKPEVRAGLCTVIMSALIYSAEATLLYLDGIGATAAVLSGYCDFVERGSALSKHFPTALGRKVHVLGIAAYLMAALQAGRPEAASVGPRLAAVAAKCVQLNAPVYQHLCGRLDKLLAAGGGRHAGAGDDEVDEAGYESDDSMDVENVDDGEEAEHGEDEGEDLDVDDTPYSRRAGGGGGDNDEEDDEELEIETTIDSICEVSRLLTVLQHSPAEIQTAVQRAWHDAAKAMTALCPVSAELIEKRATLRSSASAVHQSRAAQQQ